MNQYYNGQDYQEVEVEQATEQEIEQELSAYKLELEAIDKELGYEKPIKKMV